MDNLARNEQPIKAVNIDITPGKRMEFIDAETFEADIRADEARKWILKDIRRREREKKRREYKQALFLYKLIMRTAGSLIIAGSYLACKYIPEGGAGLLPLVFVAIVMVIAPTPDHYDDN